MRRRNLLRTCLLSAALALVALPAAAQASPNYAPSKAVNVQLGVPFTGVWPGTVYQHGSSFNHWWRLPSVLRPGDKVQVAVDNRLGDESVHLCLIPPIDDFSADAWMDQCSSEPYFGPGQQSRTTLTYEGPSGQAFLVAWVYGECCYDRGDVNSDDSGQYTATVERIESLVNIGLAVPPSLPASFALSGTVIYGDNTPAADGTPAVLQWRPAAVRGTTPAPFADLVHTTSLGGVVTFAAALPPAVQGQWIQLRACVAQPGGIEVRCGPSGRTLVAQSPCSRALDNQLRLARVVQRLRTRVRHHRAGPAKLRLKRKLKAKRRKLAKANRSVKAHCG
jgi:hypothetical protein